MYVYISQKHIVCVKKEWFSCRSNWGNLICKYSIHFLNAKSINNICCFFYEPEIWPWHLCHCIEAIVHKWIFTVSKGIEDVLFKHYKLITRRRFSSHYHPTGCAFSNTLLCIHHSRVAAIFLSSFLSSRPSPLIYGDLLPPPASPRFSSSPFGFSINPSTPTRPGHTAHCLAQIPVLALKIWWTFQPEHCVFNWV